MMDCTADAGGSHDHGRARRRPRWPAVIVLACGLGIGVAPQVVEASTPAQPPISAPAHAAPTDARRAPCSVEIVVDGRHDAPATTVADACLLSAATGVYDASDPGALPATGPVGSSRWLGAAFGAVLLGVGSVLLLATRRPRPA